MKEGVVSVIKSIDEKKKSFENGGWNISITGVFGAKPKVVNIRQIVYEIMDAALQFKDVVDQVLEFDVTKYGNFILISPSRLEEANTSRSGALAWSVVSLGLSVSTN
jgi:hypothetical protein